MTKQPAQGQNNNGWLPLAITLAIQSMVAMAMLTVPAMAPRVGAAIGVSPTYVGVYIAVAYAGAMVSSLAAGGVVGRYGGIRTSQAGLLLCAGGLALSALPSVWAIAVGAVLLGIGYGPVTPASSHLLARTTSRDRMSLVFSLKQTGVPLGGALAGAIVPGLQGLIGWQQALLAVAAACAACALVSQPLRAGFDADRDPHRQVGLGNFLHPVRLVLSDPGLRMLGGCSFVFSLAQLSLTTYVVTYLTDRLLYGLVAAGAVLSASQFGAVIGRVFWGWVADRWFGPRRMLAILGTVMVLSTLATALLTPQMPRALVVLVLFVYGATAIGWNGIYLAEVARQAPAGMAGLATGGTLAMTYFGVVVGPPLFGAISGVFDSYRAGFAALAIPLAYATWGLWRPARS